MTVMNKFKKLFIVSFIAIIALYSVISIVKVGASDSEHLYKYYTTYTIQEGDSLTSIAQRYTKDSDVTVSDYIKETRKNNKLTSADEITAGNKLVITYYSPEKK